MGRYYDIIRSAMGILGYKESKKPTIRFYNHISNPDRKKNILIVKPTAPTAKHFAIDPWGYANDSQIAYEEPDWMNSYDYAMNIRDNRAYIKNLITNKANKWDDSILLKWRKSKITIPEEHILIIGQQPHDETVNGFGFGDHWKKLCMIVDYLEDAKYPIVIKLHPGLKGKIQQIDDWRQKGITVIDGYVSIHDVLPRTRVAILENSTAGIECMMHEVPIISYGWPEYHWVTQKLQTLPQLNDLLKLDWYSRTEQEMFLHWYINRYLCKDVESTTHRLSNILWKT